MSLMRLPAAAKQISLEAEFDVSILESIQSDPARIRQILINLLGNAIKLTEVGQVRLVTRFLNESLDEPTLQFEVIESGMGMTAEQMDGIFQLFTQADSSTSRKYGGTGLGLAVCKRLVNLLKGDISAASEFQKGSTFSVTIPTGPLDGVEITESPQRVLSQSEKPDRLSTQEIKPLTCRLLLAEDDLDNQKLLSLVLHKHGADVTLAENGQIAVDIVQSAVDSGNPFDVILMDMQMPVLDGYAATRKLRAAGYTGPILALTANAMSQDREQCLDAECDDYMSKPIDCDKLIAKVAEYLRTPQSSEAVNAE